MGNEELLMKTILLLGVLAAGHAFASNDEPSIFDQVEPTRLRGGVTAGIGFFSPGPNLVFGLSGRLGAQVNRWFGVDTELGFAGGIGLSVRAASNSATTSVTAAAYVQLAVLADFMLGDHFFFDIGPAVAYAGWGGVDGVATTNGEGGRASGVAGLTPGAAAKIGLMTGRGADDGVDPTES